MNLESHNAHGSLCTASGLNIKKISRSVIVIGDM